jgi:rSAM/selenodomain-associated transferase 2
VNLDRSHPTLSVILPCLNEAAILAERLGALQPLRRAGCELILVDGGSDDGTPQRAEPLVDRVLRSGGGRGRQLNLGAEAAAAQVLWFLHIDSVPPEGAYRQVLSAAGDGGWGRWDVRLSGRRWPFRLIERMMNLRSRLTGMATGDQALFVHRDLFRAVGGFPDIPLMEDLAISRRLRRHCRPISLRPPVITSSRRWEQHGIARTVLLMWTLRASYFLGVDPRRLARWYPPCSSRAPAS